MSSRRRKALLGAGSLVLGLPLLAAPSALADDGDDHRKDGKDRRYEAELQPVPHSHPDAMRHAEGEAEVEVKGVRVDVELEVEGVAAKLPHLVHIHGDLQARNECAVGTDDADGNGLISIVEGAVPQGAGDYGYGPVQVSLTRFGGVSAADGGAFERMPTADEDGDIEYERTFTLPVPATGETRRELARSIGDMHVVVHGVDLDHDGVYDEGNPDDGDPTDAEALLPALCGELDAEH